MTSCVYCDYFHVYMKMSQIFHVVSDFWTLLYVSVTDHPL